MSLGVAIVGLGVGRQHAEAFGALQECVVRAVVDLDQGLAEETAARYPGCTPYTSFDAAIERSDIDVVSIASFDDVHFEQVTRSFAAGKHVFVEKPLCRSADELSEIRAWLKRSPQLRLASNLVLRGADLYRWLRAEIKSGAFGEIYAFDGDYLYGRLHKLTSGWRGERGGYSVMLGGGIHVIDLMLWLTNQQPKSVTAVSNRIVTRDTSFRSDDFSAGTFVFPSGMIGRITANFGCVHRHQHVVRIFGTKKSFVLDDMGPRVMIARDPVMPGTPVEAPERISLATKPDHKGVLIPSFVRAIRERGRAEDAEFALSLDAISAAIACDRSAATGTSIEIDYT
jgi:predicted dehydrogenase